MKRINSSKMIEDIKSLVDISREVGIYPDFVQGGGGNTSVKITDNLMAIKASGYLLKDMIPKDGFSFVNYVDISKHINNKGILNDTEDDFSNFIKDKTTKLDSYPALKPSIETGFHAILPYKYIIHTHSVYANILCCSQEGEGIVKKLFPNSIWVKYANPGKDITVEISKAIKSKKCEIIFMRNHGIIICSASAIGAQKLHKSVNDKIINHFNISSNYSLQKISSDTNSAKDKVIFPDQVVYLSSQELRSSTAGLETLQAYDYILNKITNLGLTPSFISKDNVDYIENMQSEKYRKSLII